MNLVLLAPGELDGERALLRGPRASHILEVHRAEPGRQLRVGVVGGRMGHAVVAAASGRGNEALVELRVGALEEDPPSPSPVTLLLAMPRPKVLRRVLGLVASAGIKRVILFGAARVEKSYWQSPLATPEAVREALLLGLEQGRDTVVPVVEQRRLFRPFVEDEGPLLAHAATALLAHPAADAGCPRAPSGPVVLAVGPEGGFVEFERSLFTAAGFTLASLGPRPLRVEHAVAVLLGRLS